MYLSQLGIASHFSYMCLLCWDEFVLLLRFDNRLLNVCISLFLWLCLAWLKKITSTFSECNAAKPIANTAPLGCMALLDEGMFRYWFAAVLCHLHVYVASWKLRQSLCTSIGFQLLFCVRTWRINQIYAHVGGNPLHASHVSGSWHWSEQNADRSTNKSGHVSLCSASAAPPQCLPACWISRRTIRNCCHTTATP